MNQFMEFASSHLKKPIFTVSGFLEWQDEDIENAGEFVFNFVDIEDDLVNEEAKNINLIKELKRLSVSLKQ